MKPEGAMEFPIGCDLAQFSAEDALEKMGIDCRTFTSKLPEIYAIICLKVASQQVGHAKMVADRLWAPSKLQVMLDIDFGYEPDEWSISLITYEGGKTQTKTVWSPGA